jgi:hypothetical protein
MSSRGRSVRRTVADRDGVVRERSTDRRPRIRATETVATEPKHGHAPVELALHPTATVEYDPVGWYFKYEVPVGTQRQATKTVAIKLPWGGNLPEQVRLHPTGRFEYEPEGWVFKYDVPDWDKVDCTRPQPATIYITKPTWDRPPLMATKCELEGVTLRYNRDHGWYYMYEVPATGEREDGQYPGITEMERGDTKYIRYQVAFTTEEV